MISLSASKRSLRRWHADALDLDGEPWELAIPRRFLRIVEREARVGFTLFTLGMDGVGLPELELVRVPLEQRQIARRVLTEAALELWIALWDGEGGPLHLDALAPIPGGPLMALSRREHRLRLHPRQSPYHSPGPLLAACSEIPAPGPVAPVASVSEVLPALRERFLRGLESAELLLRVGRRSSRSPDGPWLAVRRWSEDAVWGFGAPTPCGPVSWGVRRRARPEEVLDWAIVHRSTGALRGAPLAGLG